LSKVVFISFILVFVLSIYVCKYKTDKKKSYNHAFFLRLYEIGAGVYEMGAKMKFGEDTPERVTAL